MHDDCHTIDANAMDNREYEREIDDITDEEFCRSVAFFWEGVPDATDRE